MVSKETRRPGGEKGYAFQLDSSATEPKARKEETGSDSSTLAEGADGTGSQADEEAEGLTEAGVSGSTE